MRVYEVGKESNYAECSGLVMAGSIESVEILHDEKVVTTQALQFVNLSIDEQFVDGSEVVSKNQLGQGLKVKVKFDIPGEHNFKLALKPANNNVVYSANEITRNNNFKHMDGELSFITDSNGEKIVDGDVFVSAAGGDIFEVIAKDDDGKEVVSSGKVETRRKLFYIEAKMQGLNSVANNLTIMQQEYNKHSIELEGLSTLQIPMLENIGNDSDKQIFKANVQNAYAASGVNSKDPYCLAISYTGHLAVKNSNQKLATSNARVGESIPISLLIKGPGIDPIKDPTIKNRPLWNDIITGEDWFVDCHFIESGTNKKTNIPKTKCTPIQNSSKPAGYFDRVDIDVSWLPRTNGDVNLIVNWVDRMRGGVSFGGTNIVAICTKGYWKDVSTKLQNEIMIHEIGHQIGMAVKGGARVNQIGKVVNPSKLDSITTFYDTTQGHQGNHCHAGIPLGQARYDGRNDKKLSTCVMYGSTNGKSSFCAECANALRKVDLKNGIK